MIHKTIVLFALSLAVTAAQAVSTIKPPPPWQVFTDWLASAVKKPASGRD